MHELGIAQSIIDTVGRVAKQNGAKRIVGVRIQVGELRSVIKEQLEICFRFAAKGTPAEDARLEVEIIPIDVFCDSCKKKFRAKDLDLRCPECRQLSANILRGQELRILDMEVA